MSNNIISFKPISTPKSKSINSVSVSNNIINVSLKDSTTHYQEDKSAFNDYKSIDLNKDSLNEYTYEELLAEDTAKSQSLKEKTKKKKDGWDKFGEKAKDAGAIGVTFVASAIEGFLDLGEGVFDGSVYGIAKTLQVFGVDDKWSEDIIAYDVSGNLYDSFVDAAGIDEDIAYGKAHDIGNFVGEMAGYYALAAVPYVGPALCCVGGAGSAVEDSINEQLEETGAINDWKVFGSSALGALEGFGFGQSATAVKTGIKAVAKTGAKDALKQTLGTVSKESIKTTLKTGKKEILKKATINTLKDSDTWVETGSVLANNIYTGLETGEWDFTRMAGESATVFAGNFVGNCFGGFAEDVMSNSKKLKKNSNFPEVNSSQHVKVVETEYNANLKEKIFSRMSKTKNELQKTKYIYNKLNEEMVYSAEFFYGDQVTKSSIFNKKIDITNIQDNRIVCSNWAEMYYELLTEAGINAKVMGNSHKWVTFELSDGTKWLADATQPYNGFTDLTNSKLGTKSGGFIQITDEMYNSNDLVQGKQKMAEFRQWITQDYYDSNKKILKADTKNGYNYAVVEDLFSNAKSKSTDIFNANLNSTYGEIASLKLEQLIFPQMNQLDMMEGIGYYTTMKGILDSNEKSLISYNVLQKNDGSFYSTYTVDLQNGYVAEYIYDGKDSITKDLIMKLE